MSFLTNTRGVQQAVLSFLPWRRQSPRRVHTSSHTQNAYTCAYGSPGLSLYEGQAISRTLHTFSDT